MGSIPIYLILIIFLLSSLVIWIAGIELAKTTDTLDTRFKLGDALGGLVLLGIVTTLPEIAIIVSAALSGHYEIIIGNIVGGISIKALAIVVLDFWLKGKKPLSYLAGSKIVSLEALFVVVIATLSVIGMRIPTGSLKYSPVSVLLVVVWFVGIFLIMKLRKNKAMYKTEVDAIPGRMHHERRAIHNHVFYAKKTNLYVLAVFGLSSVATLIAAVLIEKTVLPLASYIGISGGIFSATILALVTALPEISTGIESIIIKDNQLAISDIFGGSALLPTIFIIGELLFGHPIITLASSSDVLLIIIGITMTGVYAFSLTIKPKNRYFRLGIDSVIVLIVYVVGLFVLSRLT